MNEWKPMPDFIGIGVPKAGTTWVHACLESHPEICMMPKETHFFCSTGPSYLAETEDLYATKGMPWYLERMPSSGDDAIVGDVDTLYLYDPAAPERIRSAFPNAKLFAILRDPVSRFRSQFRDLITKGRYDLPKDPVKFMREVPDQVDYGDYGEQLQRWKPELESGKLKVMRYDDLSSDPSGFLEELFAYVGANAKFAPPMLHERINPTGPQAAVREVIELKESFATHGAGRVSIRFAKATGTYGLMRDAYLKWADRKRVYEGIPEPVERDLRRRYLPQIEEVEALTGLDLSSWKP